MEPLLRVVARDLGSAVFYGRHRRSADRRFLGLRRLGLHHMGRGRGQRSTTQPAALAHSWSASGGRRVPGHQCGLSLCPAHDRHSSEEAVAQTAAVSMFSGSVARWLALMIAISCFGAMASCIMSGARVYYAMAEDGVFFRALARVSPRWRTPVASLVLQGIWSAVLALTGSYEQLFTYVMFMMVLSYVLTVAALFVLRHKQPNAPRPYRCTGYPSLPGLYVILGSIWAINAAVEKKKETVIGTLIVLAGAPLYFWWKRQKKIEAGARTSSTP